MMNGVGDWQIFSIDNIGFLVYNITNELTVETWGFKLFKRCGRCSPWIKACYKAPTYLKNRAASRWFVASNYFEILSIEDILHTERKCIR